MLSKLLDKLGNWNPQLFREIKGRLTARNVAIATFLSLIAQGCLMFYFWTKIPVVSEKVSYYGPYCANSVRNDFGRYCQAIDWDEWWYDIFRYLSWGFLIILVLAGIYMLVADLAKEKRLGTLNFISLSPQSSKKVLLGKLLGVPILIYLVIALALPLHFWSAYQANLSLDWVLVWYCLLIAISSLFYTASLVFAFLGGNQAWLASGLGAVCLWFISRIILLVTEGNYLGIEHLKWFFFPEIRDTFLLAYSLLLYRCFFRSYLLWQIANRLFRNPTATILSKKQSYLWVAEFQIFILGFCWNLMDSSKKYDFETAVVWVCILNLIGFLLLIACLSPHRQTLQDWARYQHQKSLISDLIWGEKSPALLAIAINLVITAAIWVPWILLSRQEASAKEEYVISLIMTFSLILIYAAIAQITLLSKTKKRALWAALILASLLVLLPIVCLVVAPNPDKSPFLWLFTPLSFIVVERASRSAIFIAFLSHLSVLGLLSWQLNRKLKKAGESASKSLLS